MKVKFNNITLSNIYQILNKFTGVTGKLGYAISKFNKKALPELEIFEIEKRKLFEKYGQKNSQTNELFINTTNNENYENFLKEFSPIAEDIIIEIDIFQITEKEFESNESVFEVKDATVQDFDLLQELFIKRSQQQDKTDQNNQ